MEPKLKLGIENDPCPQLAPEESFNTYDSSGEGAAQMPYYPTLVRHKTVPRSRGSSRSCDQIIGYWCSVFERRFV